MQNIKIETFTGGAAMPYLNDLAQLRVEVFRDFPYLYDGNLIYEQDYVQTYIKAMDSVLVIAFDGDSVIGVSTALPMENEPINIQKPFLDRCFDTSKIFYFGESVLKKAYRGQGIGVEFFNQREAQARKLNRF
ncbi:MAG: GNAT family N-acetyltransferase, partial [Saprospiraceae bacterium]|nr:GNAT family N-acetyltransferase [Saprospiraceae bacterium]